jgi:Flp pilus assembly protein CpaB
VELEYTDRNSKRSKLYIAVGLIIALIVGGLVFVALRFSSVAQSAQVEMRSVVVAARDIPTRKPIEEGDLVMRSVPADPTNAQAFARIDDVLGRISGVPIASGEMVTSNMLASTTSGQAFSILEAGQQFDPNGPDLRAVSVTVPDERAVAGTLQPGQHVDLIVTMAMNPSLGQTAGQSSPAPGQSPDPLVAGPSTKVTLQDMTLLARNGSIYILRSDLATAEQIAELQAAGGQFTLVLRPDQDTRTAKTSGSTVDSLVKEFGFPFPKAPLVGGQSATP